MHVEIEVAEIAALHVPAGQLMQNPDGLQVPAQHGKQNPLSINHPGEQVTVDTWAWAGTDTGAANKLAANKAKTITLRGDNKLKMFMGFLIL